MPLEKSGSRAAISRNIREMVASGHPQNQAVAAALRTADEAMGRGKKRRLVLRKKKTHLQMPKASL